MLRLMRPEVTASLDPFWQLDRLMKTVSSVFGRRRDSLKSVVAKEPLNNRGGCIDLNIDSIDTKVSINIRPILV